MRKADTVFMLDGKPWHHYTDRTFGPDCKNCGHRAIDHHLYIMGDPCDHCACDTYEPRTETENERGLRQARDEVDRQSPYLRDSDGNLIVMRDWPTRD